MAEFPIVAIGSSAGGLEALQVLFRTMPADVGAAFVIAAHLDPTQESHLSELLGRCTPMPVQEIGDEVRLEPNRVYVIAPDRELTIRQGVVRSEKPTAPRGHRHPVDSFFRSLAEDQGERAVAIILSGTGSNGSLGLRFIKAEGGIVIAQEPDSARFGGMPRSAISTGIVDNEELQASNEELETSKEELQSLNEELNTVNSQLEAKLAELEERTADLDNLLNSTQIATLFLDRALCIRWFTPSMKQLLELRSTDIGRPASHFAQRFTDGDMIERVQRVLDTLVPADDEVISDEGRCFIRRILPYRTANDRIEGVVLTFVDITERKRAVEALARSERRLQQVLETDTVGVIFFDHEGRLIDANDVFLRMTGYTRAEVEGGKLSWQDMTPPEWVEAFQEHMRRLDETGRIGPYEMEYLLNDGRRAWMLFAGRKLDDGTVVEYVIDITGRKHAEEERELLTHELSHRVKNMLAVVQAIAMQTDGGTGSIDEYRDKFVGRLQALGRTHGLLLETQWRGTRLDRLVERALEPYTAEAAQSVEVDGEAVPVSAGVCIALSLVLHELATNAVKYGALSVPEGRLGISWTVEPVVGRRRVRLIWRERGGPRVEPPTEQGFGTKLIQRAFAHELGGEVELDYAPEGLTCTITFEAE